MQLFNSYYNYNYNFIHQSVDHDNADFRSSSWQLEKPKSHSWNRTIGHFLFVEKMKRLLIPIIMAFFFKVIFIIKKYYTRHKTNFIII